MRRRCFACNKPIRGSRQLAQVKGETTIVDVGPDCFLHVKRAGPAGYQPPLGGPVLIPVTKEAMEEFERRFS